MWRKVELWDLGAGGGEGGELENMMGMEAHSQQDCHKGGFFLQESLAGNEREGLLMLFVQTVIKNQHINIRQHSGENMLLEVTPQGQDRIGLWAKQNTFHFYS